MSLFIYIKRIQRLDDLIRRKSTGPPAELAERLGVSERWLYHVLNELRQDLGCPIRYDRRRKSYTYADRGKVIFGFRSEEELKDPKKIRGGCRFGIRVLQSLKAGRAEGPFAGAPHNPYGSIS